MTFNQNLLILYRVSVNASMGWSWKSYVASFLSYCIHKLGQLATCPAGWQRHPISLLRLRGKKKTTDNCGNLIATKATQGSFWCNLIQQEPVTFRNHCQLVRRFMFFPANQWLCHSQDGKQFSSNVRMMSSDASIEQLPKKPHINPSGANQLFTLKLGLQYFTCTVHTFTDSVYIF